MTGFETRMLTPETWPDFAALVEASGGVWGGCWCIGFHPDGFQGSPAGNCAAKRAHVEGGTVHQVLVYRDDECVGWVQFGPPSEVATIKNAKAYDKELVDLPDWRIGCVFTGSKHRRQGASRAGLTAALDEIARAGGGVVEAYPEQLEGRGPQRGAYLHTGAEDLYTDLGFERDRQIAKWRWVMRLTVPKQRARAAKG
ncbi:GNAT family N-acetyltransferase [Angustibacter peucedani]